MNHRHLWLMFGLLVALMLAGDTVQAAPYIIVNSTKCLGDTIVGGTASTNVELTLNSTTASYFGTTMYLYWRPTGSTAWSTPGIAINSLTGTLAYYTIPIQPIPIQGIDIMLGTDPNDFQSGGASGSGPKSGGEWTIMTIRPCAPAATGSICGRKVWDKNCDGILSKDEPGLAGWVINCTPPGVSVITDANGNFCFNGLPVGQNYDITESPQNGWTQSSPASGGYHQFIGDNVTPFLLFGNCKQDCTPPPVGLVAWWPFDETSVANGASVGDLTSLPGSYSPINTGNTGTIVGNGVASDFSGYVSSSFNFPNNPSSYVKVTNTAGLDFTTNNFSIDCWVKLDSGANGIRTIIVKRTGSSTLVTGYALFVGSGNTLGFQLGYGTGFQNFISSGAIAANTWTFVAVTVDRAGKTVKLYINGAAPESFTITPASSVSISNTAQVTIGRDFVNGDYPFSGSIDELEVFDLAVTQQTLSNIFVAGKMGKCKKLEDGLGSLSTVCGSKFNDLNGNGIREIGEQGIAGWTVYISDIFGNSSYATTDASGNYCIDSLSSGTYWLNEVQQTGWTQTLPFANFAWYVGIPQYGGTFTGFDFGNHKNSPPPCDSAIRESLVTDSCEYCVLIANNNSAGISSLNWSVLGGTVVSMTASGCTNTITGIGTSSGTITFTPVCHQNISVCLKASPNAGNPTGTILATWTTIHANPAKDSCSFITRYECVDSTSMSDIDTGCCDAVSALPYVDQGLQISYRTVTIVNVRGTPITYIDVEYFDCNDLSVPLTPSSGPQGGGYLREYRNSPFPYRNPTSSTAYFPFSWASNYRRIPNTGVLPAYGDGSFMQNSVVFNIGLNYLVTPETWCIRFTVHHGPDDSCVVWLNDWTPKPPSFPGVGIIPEPIGGHIYGVALKLDAKQYPVGTLGFVTVTVADSSDRIVGGTGGRWLGIPDSTDTLPGKLVVQNFVQSDKTALFILRGDEIDAAPFNVFIATPEETTTPKVIWAIYDKNANILSMDTVQTTSTVSVVNPPKVDPGTNDVVINSVIPNPSSGSVTFNYTLGASQDAHLELFDMLGRSVATIADGFQSKGEHEVNYNVGSLAEGTYYLRLTTRFGTASAVVKVIH